MRFVSGLFTSAHLFAQCDDIEISTKKAEHLSEVEARLRDLGAQDLIEPSYFASAECGRDE